MISLAYKGANLESSIGSFPFLFLVLYALVASHTIAVTLAATVHALGYPHLSGYNTCAVGFSAVLFCIKYIWNQTADSSTYIYGISVPTKYAAWAECFLITLLTPNVSFLGHVSGIIAGVCYAHLPRIRLLNFRFPSYTYTRGISGTRERFDDVPLHDDDDHARRVRSRREASINATSMADALEMIRGKRLQKFN